MSDIQRKNLKSEARIFLAAVEHLCDWINERDIAADYKEQCPVRFERLCASMVDFRACLEAAELASNTKEPPPKPIEQAVTKQSTPGLSTLAAKMMDHEDPDVRSLAASVLSQDETEGQDDD